MAEEYTKIEALLTHKHRIVREVVRWLLDQDFFKFISYSLHISGYVDSPRVTLSYQDYEIWVDFFGEAVVGIILNEFSQELTRWALGYHAVIKELEKIKKILEEN